jgi:hypothetical protein
VTVCWIERVIGDSLLERERGLLLTVCWRERGIGDSLLEREFYW